MVVRLERAVSAPLLRNFVFGVEDSLVSTIGLLSGVAIAGVSRPTIVLTGVVLIFVEAFSMGVGSFLSESSEFGYVRGKEAPIRRPLGNAAVMFVSYLFSGFIPLAPYLALPSDRAFPLSIVLSLAALFLLGVVGAKISRLRVLRGGARMAVIGGSAILVGIAAGKLAVR
jgi:VIT1/CCC1 family predicted Fe2+/Mn2+ transporter